MKSLYRSVASAAFVVGSSLTLLTGAQGDAIIDFGPRTNAGNFGFSQISPASATTIQVAAGAATGVNASFDGLTGGTFSWPNTTVRFTGLSADGANFDTVTNAAGNPATVNPFSVTFPSPTGPSTLSGQIILTELLGANTLTPELIGTFNVNTSTGIFSSVFPLGSMEPFQWMLNTVGANTTTPVDCLTAGVCIAGLSPATFSGGAGILGVPGPIVGAGLPGLIAALGGLVAMARRRRKQLA